MLFRSYELTSLVKQVKEQLTKCSNPDEERKLRIQLEEFKRRLDWFSRLFEIRSRYLHLDMTEPEIKRAVRGIIPYALRSDVRSLKIGDFISVRGCDPVARISREIPVLYCGLCDDNETMIVGIHGAAI